MTTRGKASRGVVVVDVINHFEFPDGDKILRSALQVAPNLRRLLARARREEVPIIYVNYCLRPEAPGRKFVEQVRPLPEDYFVLKPKHSAFYQTPLETLLSYLKIDAIVLCGLTTHSCIACSAHDANMRDLEAVVVSDACAARTQVEHRHALELLAGLSNCRIIRSRSVAFR
jgi:nicotinamidase-related amidase